MKYDPHTKFIICYFQFIIFNKFLLFQNTLIAKLLLALQLNCVSMSDSVVLLGIFLSAAYCVTTMVLVILLNHSIIVKKIF